MAVATGVWCIAPPPGVPGMRHRGLWHTGEARVCGVAAGAEPAPPPAVWLLAGSFLMEMRIVASVSRR